MKTSTNPYPGSVSLGSVWLRRALIAAALIGFVASAPAAVIVGQVQNKNTRKFLERALINVEGTSFAALTDSNGSFRINGLPPGTYTVRARYTDLDPASVTVTLASDDDTQAVDLSLTSEVYELDQFVVTGTLEGTAFSLNQQRRSESARSVTSIDAFIDQSTGNPGEFLKNVQGIQMDYSQNEPQTIRIRGFDPNLTTVTMDGNEIASAASSSGNRAVQIDQLSIASIESVEVYKSPIPSMSANAIGGAVNFRTRTARNQEGPGGFVQLGVNMDSHDFGFSKSPGPGHGEKAERRIYPGGRLQYLNSFFDNRLGVMFSIGHDQTNQIGSSTTNNVDARALPGTTLPAQPTPFTLETVQVRRGAFSISPNRQLRVRDDISLNLDFQLSDNVELFLNTSYTDYLSTNRNHSFTLNPNNTFAAGSTLTDFTVTSGLVTQGVSVFDKNTHSMQFSPGLRFKSGDWKIDLIGSSSKSINRYKNPGTFGSLSLRLDGNAGWSMSVPTNTEVPTSLVQTSGRDFYDLANYRPNQNLPANGILLANSSSFVSNNKRDTWNTKYSGRLDVQRDFKLSFPLYLKSGLSYNENILDKRQQQRRWYWAGDDGIIGTADDNTLAANIGRFVEPVPVRAGVPGQSLREPTYFSTNELWKYWQANPQVLAFNEAYNLQQFYQGRGKVNEQVSAVYAMGNATLGKWNVLAGVRIEETKVRTEGFRVDNRLLPAGVNANSLAGIAATHSFVTNRSGYTSDPFPYLHLRYEITDNLQARASYTEAIGRPNTRDLIPGGFSFSETNQTVTSNNRAGLLPQRSQNIDLSLEYYFKNAGELSIGWFNRDVEDYITSTRLPLTPALLEELDLGSEFSNYDLITRSNLGFATWNGFEVSYRQSLRDFKALPSFVQGFMLWANYTKIVKMSGDFGTPGLLIDELAGVVPEMFNAGLGYRTPRGKFEIKLTTNFQGEKPLDDLPANSANGQRVRVQLDYQFWNLESSYRVNDKILITATGRNIASERGQFSDLGVIRNTQQATGIAWFFSTKYDF